MLDANKYSYTRLSHYRFETNIPLFLGENIFFSLKFPSDSFDLKRFHCSYLGNEWDSGNLHAWSNSAFSLSMVLGKPCNQFGPYLSHT